ncbi:MAG: hypothetical protein K2X77_01400 [Candidatus Obscuribacterales bacterium]|nr:hypothetical protein [Candidatus Obscuribacterales bacterium]
MSDRLSLFDWYLARLRRRAAQERQSGNLTPLALVGSDKNLIEELVSQAAVSKTARFNELQSHFESNDNGVRRWLKALICLAIVSAVILAVCLFNI